MEDVEVVRTARKPHECTWGVLKERSHSKGPGRVWPIRVRDDVGVKTRTLLVLALVTGLAILIAGILQISAGGR